MEGEIVRDDKTKTDLLMEEEKKFAFALILQSLQGAPHIRSVSYIERSLPSGDWSLNNTDEDDIHPLQDLNSCGNHFKE